MNDLDTLRLEFIREIQVHKKHYIKCFGWGLLLSFLGMLLSVIFTLVDDKSTLIKPSLFQIIVLAPLVVIIIILVIRAGIESFSHKHNKLGIFSRDISELLRYKKIDMDNLLIEEDYSLKAAFSAMAIYDDLLKNINPQPDILSEAKESVRRIVELCTMIVKLDNTVKSYGVVDENTGEETRQMYEADVELFKRRMETLESSIAELNILRIQLARYEVRKQPTVEIIDKVKGINRSLDEVIEFVDERERHQ